MSLLVEIVEHFDVKRAFAAVENADVGVVFVTGLAVEGVGLGDATRQTAIVGGDGYVVGVGDAIDG